MPTIHVIYDPDSRIQNRPEELKQIHCTAITFQCDAPTIENIDTTINNLVELVLEQVMGKV